MVPFGPSSHWLGEKVKESSLHYQSVLQLP
jgi:hypothetical protein